MLGNIIIYGVGAGVIGTMGIVLYAEYRIVLSCLEGIKKLVEDDHTVATIKRCGDAISNFIKLKKYIEKNHPSNGYVIVTNKKATFVQHLDEANMIKTYDATNPSNCSLIVKV